MFVYQSVIMLVIVLVVFILAFVIKLKHRSILALSILVLVVAGSLSINLIQDYFLGMRVSTQNVDVNLYKNMDLTDIQKNSLEKTFSDYTKITSDSFQYKTALEKNYTIKDGSNNSSIKVFLLLFKSKASADETFKQHEMFGENVYKMFSEKRYFIPEDSKKSNFKSNPKYLTTSIRSNYSNPTELMYVTENIYYQSEIVVQDDDFILYMTERSNEPKSEKNSILQDINNRLAKIK